MKKIKLNLTYKQADLVVRALELHVTGVESDLDATCNNDNLDGEWNVLRGAERVAYKQERIRSYSLLKVINKRAKRLFGQDW